MEGREAQVQIQPGTEEDAVGIDLGQRRMKRWAGKERGEPCDSSFTPRSRG